MCTSSKNATSSKIQRCARLHVRFSTRWQKQELKTEVLAGCIFVRVSPRECMVLQNVVNPINQFGLTMFNQNMVIYLVIMIYNMYIYIYIHYIYIYTYCTWWIYGDIIDTLDWFAWFWSRPNPLWRHWNNGNWIRESSPNGSISFYFRIIQCIQNWWTNFFLVGQWQLGVIEYTPTGENALTMTPQSWFARHWHWVYMGLPPYPLVVKRGYASKIPQP